MKIVYLGHSGFLLEWETCYWIFDYYRGTIPLLDPKKTIFVFCSHSHEDHFNPEIFALAGCYPSVKYIFASQVRPTCRRLIRRTPEIVLSERECRRICADYPDRKIRQPGEEGERNFYFPIPVVEFITDRSSMRVEDGAGGAFQIQTMRSTDCGCAFLIEYQGHLVYHAGDLHWWCWSGEPEETSRQMTANFKKEMETIAGRDIEIAFVPLDGRLEDNYGLGMQYLLEQAHVHHVFPMHFWDKPEVMDRYLQEYPVPEHTRFHRIIKDGESWDICDI